MGLFGEIRHDISRLSEIAQVMTRHGFGPTLRKVPLVSRMIPGGQQQSPVPAPQRFARMLEELGPTFVKLGQILSTRSDILPREFTDELSKLQDQVPPFPFDEVQAQIEEDLGAPLADLFDDFDEKPLASASMAQVHTAVLDGEPVVVKVLRPGIHEQVRADASILVLLAQLLETLVMEASQYRVGSLAQEFEEGLRGELDFSREAANLKTFRAFNEGREGVHVPFLVEERSSRRVLTMERIFGQRITVLADRDDPAESARVVERLVSLGYDHFFVDGMFHADPHPGNVLITDDGDIAFIDFGLVGRVSRATQDRLLMVLIAISLRDADTLARLLVRVGDVDQRIQLGAFRDAIARLLDRYLDLSLKDVNASAALVDLLDLASTFGVRTPREFALLSKASVAMDGIIRALHPDLNPSSTMIERSRSLLLERLDPRNLQGGGLRTALQLGVLLQELPLQMNQTLLDLERGNLRIRMASDELQRLERDFRGLGMTIFSGLIAAAFVLGGIYAIAQFDLRLFGVPVLPIVSFGIAGFLFFVAFTWFLTGGRVPKLSASALLSLFSSRRRDDDRR